jgi:hypothetical protein
MLPFLFGALALALVAVFSRVVDCGFQLVLDPYDFPMDLTMLLLWSRRCDASMVQTMCLSVLVSAQCVHYQVLVVAWT